MQALEHTPAAPLVRVACNDAPRIKRALDLGPSGCIIPYVSSEEEARAGDGRAAEAWHSFGQRLIWLLGILGRVIDPDLFVLGGSLSSAHDLFDAELQQASLRWPVRVSNDSGEMAMRGAAVTTGAR